MQPATLSRRWLQSTLITIASYPMYDALYHAYSVVGLAMASDWGIAAKLCLVMAILLHRRKLVLTTGLPWLELAKAAIAAAAAGLVES